MKSKNEQRKRRHARVRAKIKGTAQIPRLSVFRSNRHVYAQLIDDEKGRTLVAASVLSGDAVKKPARAPRAGRPLKEQARFVGQDLAKKAKAKKIMKVVFDRGGFQYTGSVKAVADSAREGGLKF